MPRLTKFIDTPVKHYSSGMYLPYFFAVAAHLEPEILIVDEVLAVGDARFQKKCLNKMQDVGEKGRTVLFVSHNMQAITRMCSRSILLDQGSVIKDGSADEVTRAYLGSGLGISSVREWKEKASAPSGEVARLWAVRVRTENGMITDRVDIRHPVRIEMEYDVVKPGYILLPHYMVYNEEGILLFKTLDWDPEWRGRRRPVGRYTSTAFIPGNFLSEGLVVVSAALITLNPTIVQFWERDVVSFEVFDNFTGDSARGEWSGQLGGVVRPLLQWENRLLSDRPE